MSGFFQILRGVAKLTRHPCLAEPARLLSCGKLFQQVVELGGHVFPTLCFVVAILSNSPGWAAGNAGIAPAIDIKEAV